MSCEQRSKTSYGRASMDRFDIWLVQTGERLIPPAWVAGRVHPQRRSAVLVRGWRLRPGLQQVLELHVPGADPHTLDLPNLQRSHQGAAKGAVTLAPDPIHLYWSVRRGIHDDEMLMMTTMMIVTHDDDDPNGALPLAQMTLVWHDYPAAATVTSVMLVNNLDIRATHAGTTYYPNGRTGPDSVNNVEQVRALSFLKSDHDVFCHDTGGSPYGTL
jgi:hypothetical protein